MNYQEAKAKQARLYRQGVFVAVVRQSDGSYAVEQPGGPRQPVDLAAIKRKRTLRLVRAKAEQLGAKTGTSQQVLEMLQALAH